MEEYLLHRMTPSERTAFEARLAADPALRARVSEMRLLMTGIAEAALSEKLNDFHSQLPVREPENKTGRKPPVIGRWLAAASIFLLVGLFGWWLIAGGNREEKLFAAYFKPDPGLLTAMGATTNYAFDRAMVEYKKGNYAAAIQGWDSLQKRQPVNDTLAYFLGVANLAAGKTGAAIPCLQKVTVLPSGLFTSDAGWYLGLALLKEGRREEAVKALEQSSHENKEELLRQVKTQ